MNTGCETTWGRMGVSVVSRLTPHGYSVFFFLFKINRYSISTSTWTFFLVKYNMYSSKLISTIITQYMPTVSVIWLCVWGKQMHIYYKYEGGIIERENDNNRCIRNLTLENTTQAYRMVLIRINLMFQSFQGNRKNECTIVVNMKCNVLTCEQRNRSAGCDKHKTYPQHLYIYILYL